MDADVIFTLAVLLVAIVLFITDLLRVDLVAMGVVLALLLSDILTPAEAFAGFSNTAVVTIAALFVVGGAVFQTGLANEIGERILAIAGRNETRLSIVIMVAVAGLSGFMSNTGTVAVLLPAVTSLAVSAKISPSKLLIPLAFASSLGGVITLIGTPPNIVVASELRNAGYDSFSFFSYAPIGIILLVAGVAYMVLIGQRLLPEQEAKPEPQRTTSPEELLDAYRVSGNLFRLRVRGRSQMVGRPLAETKLRSDFNVIVLEILRGHDDHSSGPLGLGRGNSERKNSFMPMAETLLQTEDILLVQGTSNDVSHAAATYNFGIQPALAEDEASLINQELGVAEVVLPPTSSVLGKTLVGMRFGSRYRLTVLSIQRPGEDEIRDEIKSTPLRFGDILLVQGTWQDILKLRDNPNDFVVMGQPESQLLTPRRDKAWITLAILGGIVALIVADVFPVSTTSVLGALAVILTGCITVDEAYDAMDWKSIFLIAGMIPMSTALQSTGIVDELAAQLQQLDQFGPIVVMVALFIMTSVLTQVISNTATTILLAPVAIATAVEIGVEPHAFMMAIAVSASMAFASPVASPVNTLVMGAGNYRFRDYMIVGVPLILLTMIVSMIFIPLFYGF